jgi:hypothetical protein
MSAAETSPRIVDLSEYRAARNAAAHRGAAPAPYLLWYPGVGYVQVLPTAANLATVAKPLGQNQRRF